MNILDTKYPIDIAINGDTSSRISLGRIQLRPGDWMTIDGPSGIGKTTVLLELIHQILSDAYSISGIEPLRFGYVPQKPSALVGSVIENIRYGRDIDLEDMNDLLSVVELCGESSSENFLNRRVDEKGYPLSGGEFQRVALCRALASKPNLLLCDEPTSSLNEDLAVRIFIKLRELYPAMTVVLISHSPAIKKISDYSESVRRLDGI